MKFVVSGQLLIMLLSVWIFADESAKTIHNSAAPLHEKSKISLQQVWKIGGEDPGFIFNNPAGMDVDDAGTIFITDLRESDVKCFSPQGELLCTFGRKRKGPGEFVHNHTITCLPDDEILAIDGTIVMP